jgi:C-terminal processing protease CtpA/Prc
VPENSFPHLSTLNKNLSSPTEWFVIPSGRDFQFTGLYPDVPIWIKPEDSFKEVDSIFEKAISILLNF